MATITINVSGETTFGNKVAGEFLPVDVSKMSDSWKAEIFRYGFRKINDNCKGNTGDERLALARLMVKEINTGDEFVGRSRGGAVTMSSVDRLTLAIAKKELTRRFKLLTKCGRIADMCTANPRVAEYFDGTTWHDARVVEWNASETGQTFDAKGQAKKEIADMKTLADTVSVDDI